MDESIMRYIKLHNEFNDFIKANYDDFKDSYERKLLNLILNKFDDIADSGTARSKRSNLINDAIQAKGKTVSDNLPRYDSTKDQKNFEFEKLSSIKISHFRGFNEEEVIDIDKRINLIYGPNGSGKSSFCEALEFSLLGYINEAISKRIEITKYIKNAFSNKLKYPELYYLDEKGLKKQVRAKQDLYNFCFVEKNRIDDFSRIAASKPSEKKNLIALLFGLSEFSDFVNNFSTNIEMIIDIEGLKNIELNEKLKTLEQVKKEINDTNSKLNEIENEKKKILVESNFDGSFSKYDIYIHGSDEEGGELDKINNLLLKDDKEEYIIVKTDEIDLSFKELEKDLEENNKLNENYNLKKDKVSFRDLYESAIQLENKSKDKCPLCETPVDSTTKNPFENARDNIVALSNLAELEAEINESNIALSSHLRDIDSKIKKREVACKKINEDYLAPDIDKGLFDLQYDINTHNDKIKNICRVWKRYHKKNIEIDNKIALLNAEAIEANKRKDKLKEEYTKIKLISDRIKEIKITEQTHSDNIKKWKLKITNFNKDNKNLIDEVAKEKISVEENKKYVNAYNSLLKKLIQYRDNLPVEHLKNLNELTLTIYNEINQHDNEYEKLTSITLPSKPEDSITIAFMNDPTDEYDSLQILSEGHIRCLGLAILLAKNVYENCPLIIFDDIVNAIDDEHRGGIRKLIHDNKLFQNKQIVLTTHAELFVNDIENYFKVSDYKNNVNKYTFMPDNDIRVIRIITENASNYLIKVEELQKKGNNKEALYNCRCSLENLIYKIWNRIGNKYNEKFKVKIRKPYDRPELMELTQTINSFLKKNESEKYAKIIPILDFLISYENKNNAVWNYLNMGTHEEENRNEFDKNVVNEIYENIVKLNSEIN